MGSQNGSITQVDRKVEPILGPSQCCDALMLAPGEVKWLNHAARSKGRTCFTPGGRSSHVRRIRGCRFSPDSPVLQQEDDLLMLDESESKG